MKAEDFLKFISHRHAGPSWAVFHEFRCGTGYGGGNQSRIDSLVLGMWPSKGLVRIAYEVKVSRSDFLREAKKPVKQVPALRVSNLFYYLTPPGIVKVDEVPPWAGLMEVERMTPQRAAEKVSVGNVGWYLKNKPFVAREVVPAPDRIVEFEQVSFIAALARRVCRIEAASASAEVPVPGDNG